MRLDLLTAEKELTRRKPPSESTTERTQSLCSKGESDERHHER